MVTYFSHVTGTSGQLVTLNANYFALPTVTNFHLYQYHVSFAPNEENKAAKHKMVRDHKEKLGGYLFDGSMLYTSYSYDEDVSLISFYYLYHDIKIDQLNCNQTEATAVEGELMCVMIHKGTSGFKVWHYLFLTPARETTQELSINQNTSGIFA
jgi:hypothetical protein